MAVPDGPAPDHLSFLRRAAAEVWNYDIFALLRGAEARARTLPRIGRSRRRAQNIADGAHASTLNFPARTVEAIEPGPHGRMKVRSLYLGLTGPMGALPIHLTEYAFHEGRGGEARPFGDWLDLISDRMLQLFYRAWAESQPAASADRPDDDSFAGYLAKLSGAMEGAVDTDALPKEARLHYAGLFATRRSAAALQDGLSHLLRTPVRIEEFVLRWRDVEPADRSRLGGPERGGFNALGLGAVLGGRVRMAEDTFRVLVHARSWEEYESFLPGGARFAAAREALDALTPTHLDWELQLEIDEPKVRGARLDGLGRLGLTSWMAPLGRTVRRGDARLRRADFRRAA